MTQSELRRAERKLREYDKALRLRYSALRASTLLLERKTFRGRIGRCLPGGDAYDLDGGRRREEGHVLIASLPDKGFNVSQLLDTLRARDTWRHAKPLWQRVEEREAYLNATQKISKSNDNMHKAAEFWNRYAWSTKSRVAGGL